MGFPPIEPWLKGELSPVWTEGLLAFPAAAQAQAQDTEMHEASPRAHPTCGKSRVWWCHKKASGAPASPRHWQWRKDTTSCREHPCRPSRSCRRCQGSLHGQAWGRARSISPLEHWQQILRIWLVGPTLGVSLHSATLDTWAPPKPWVSLCQIPG